MLDSTRDIARRVAQRIEASPARFSDGRYQPPWDTTDPPPSFVSPVSQACTHAQMTTTRYRAWCASLGEEPRAHRKQWEHCFILQTLADRGVIGRGRSGIGFGVGREALVAVLAAQGCDILATDLPPLTAGAELWTGSGQHASNFDHLNERGLCPPDEFAARVTSRHLDMRDLPVGLGPFDFSWSSCVIEHLGSRRAGLGFVEEHLSMLRPGGIAVHTTELNVSSRWRTPRWGETVLFLRRDFEKFAARMTTAGHHVRFNWNLGDSELDRHLDVAPFGETDHLKLVLGGYHTTSFGLIVTKAG